MSNSVVVGGKGVGMYGRMRNVDYGVWARVCVKVVMMSGEVVGGKRVMRLKEVMKKVSKNMKVNLDVAKMKMMMGEFVVEKRQLRLLPSQSVSNS